MLLFKRNDYVEINFLYFGLVVNQNFFYIVEVIIFMYFFVVYLYMIIILSLYVFVIFKYMFFVRDVLFFFWQGFF